MIAYPVWDVGVVAEESAVAVSPVVAVGWVDVGVEDELVAVGVVEFVELDPQAERANKARRSRVTMIAFEIVTRGYECIIRIVLS